MRTTLLLLTLAIAVSSCYEYQYLTVAGVDIRKTGQHEFVSESDSLEIRYRFTGRKGQVAIAVFNRTHEPLVIDWWKSAIIVGEETFSYYNSNAPFDGMATSDTLLAGQRLWNNGKVYVADLNGTVHLDEPSQFLPPNTGITKSLMALPVGDSLPGLSANRLRNDTLHISTYTWIPCKKASFDKGASPMTFRSYLTFRIGRGGQERELTKEHTFYISDVWKTATEPGSMPANTVNRGDLFYLLP